MAMTVNANPAVQFYETQHDKIHPIKVDPKITNLFTLTVEQLRPIIEALNQRYKDIEYRDQPAAGYRLYFKMLSPGKRPLEIELHQFNERKEDDEMKLPPNPPSADNCAFCNPDASIIYPISGFTAAKVILSKDGNNPLSVSKEHYPHFFEMPIQAQIDMVMMAITSLRIETNEECTRATISSHIGAGDLDGHQNYRHAHMHFEASTGRKS